MFIGSRYYTVRSTAYGSIEVSESTTLTDGDGRRYEYSMPKGEFLTIRDAQRWARVNPLRQPHILQLLVNEVVAIWARRSVTGGAAQVGR
jgi:hypothetical protein